MRFEWREMGLVFVTVCLAIILVDWLCCGGTIVHDIWEVICQVW